MSARARRGVPPPPSRAAHRAQSVQGRTARAVRAVPRASRGGPPAGQAPARSPRRSSRPQRCCSGRRRTRPRPSRRRPALRQGPPRGPTRAQGTRERGGAARPAPLPGEGRRALPAGAGTRRQVGPPERPPAPPEPPARVQRAAGPFEVPVERLQEADVALEGLHLVAPRGDSGAHLAASSRARALDRQLRGAEDRLR